MVIFSVLSFSKPRDFLLGNLDLSEHLFGESVPSRYEHRIPILIDVGTRLLPSCLEVGFGCDGVGVPFLYF